MRLYLCPAGIYESGSRGHRWYHGEAARVMALVWRYAR